MDLLDVSKENIQPLRYGRNISTLNTALQAQTDAEIYQQLMKEREEFEILVRSYAGDDPLKPWYDYVLWVEQNFPKHGREGNLKVLLENCLLEFKENEQYSQDVRYIDLWTRYMSFADDPLEMYKQIHARGIGANCAIFYQCWAEEYEKANDMKRADQIYIEGIRRNAQPIDELVSAHTDFQVRVARNILGQNPIITQEHAVEERTALSTLRAHGRRKNMVDSTRFGHSIKHATPGVLRSHSNVPLADRRNGNVQISKLAVYNDENAPFTDAVANPVVKSSVSLSQQSTNNKENTLKPGRWNEGKFKKKCSASAVGMSGVPATPRNPKFQVHVDENSDVPRTPKTDIVASNVLKMRKHVYEDEKNIPVAMFEPTDPRKIAVYPKNKVYSGGTEFSLEELRAIMYLKRDKERHKVSHETENNDRVELSEIHLDVPVSEQRDDVEEQEYLSEHDSQQLNVLRQKSLISEQIEMKQQQPQKNSFEVFVEAEEEMNAKLKQKDPDPPHNLIETERKLVAPPAKLWKNIPLSGCLKVPKFLKEHKEDLIQTRDEIFQSGPSFEQKECDQSLTVNTKAVLNEVKDMWVSSPLAEPKPVRASFVPRPNVGYCTTQPSVRPASAPVSFTPFKIFSDVSMLEPEQVSSINVHPGKESEGKVQHVQANCVQMVDNSCSWKERDVDKAGQQMQANYNWLPQKSIVLPRDVFNTYLTVKKQDVQVPEMHALKKDSEAERDIFRSLREDAVTVPRMSPESLTKGKLLTPRDNFSVYTDPSVISTGRDEVPDPSVDIPFVPSPGMTPAQVQENTFSDETCCTEAFAIPLVSSTPILHPHLKTLGQEVKQDNGTEDNTIAMMNWYQKTQSALENVPTPKVSTVYTDQTKDVADVPCSTRVSVLSTRLSTIFELSERKKSSSMGTTDGSCASKSSGCEAFPKYCGTSKHISPVCHQIPELELEEDIKLLRNLNQTRKNIMFTYGPLSFFSNSFRDHCLAKGGFPSELHQPHCVQLHLPFDTDISPGTQFIAGENHYSILNVVSKGNETVRFTAVELFSRRLVEIEVKDNTHIWEQYIREEIRLRLKDQSVARHFIANEITYIFTNKHLMVYSLHNHLNLKDMLKEKMESIADLCNLASEIINILFHLHQCNIVHGSLSVQSFVCSHNILILNNFEKAIDTTLLPADTVFDATEESMYYMLRACRLAPFQVDYLALANILHQMIFKEPMKVHEEMGKWYISSVFPRNFDSGVWDKVFRELLNNSDVNLLHLRCLLEDFLISRKMAIH